MYFKERRLSSKSIELYQLGESLPNVSINLLIPNLFRKCSVDHCVGISAFPARSRPIPRQMWAAKTCQIE